MPTNFDFLFDAIHEREPVSATYEKDEEGAGPRHFLPYVLGRSQKPESDPSNPVEENMVLCYQYAGHSPGGLEDPPSPKNWRCFKVDLLDELAVSDVPVDFDPPKMSGQQRKRQNCVEIRVKWRTH